MNTDLSGRIRGIVTPLVTPLAGRDALDAKGLAALVEHVLSAGVHGVFLLGTSGEAPSLSYRLRNEVIRKGCEFIGGRVPVLVGITDTSIKESVRLAAAAAEQGADALVVAPPFYFSCDQEELFAYFTHVADRVSLPLYLYNIPSCTKVEIAPETVERLAENPNVLGLKDSSGNMAYFHQVSHLMHGRDDFQIMIGPEEFLVEALVHGAAGGIAGGSNLFPKLYVDIYEAVQSGDLPKARKLHEVIMQISMGIYNIHTSYLKGLKCALSLIGLCDERLAEPLNPLRKYERKAVEQVLREIGLRHGLSKEATAAG